MSVRLYNTMSRSIEEFKSIKPGQVGLYCCGPTVYNFAHIGNLRTFLFEDILKRTLIHYGYKVKHVMNITDVGHLVGDGDEGEDKLEKSARETGSSVWDISKKFTQAFFEDFDCLNMIRPQITCKATEHISDMIKLIERLEKGGHTYVSGGNVYFSIDTLDDYGKLARLDLNELKSGARICVDDNKKNPLDFVLWFTKSKFGHQAMMWDSPWGRGYPGWHIECSAMSMKYLGEHFDIHCGGVDAIPVHHTNEIAQSEAATGKTWVNYWLHGEFLLSDKGKMSKSNGTFLTMQVLKDAGYDPLDYRYFCLGGHYRTQLQFSYKALDGARTARKGVFERIISLKNQLDCDKIPSIDEISDKKVLDIKKDFDEHITNDLNTPRALADFWNLIKNEEVNSAEKLSLCYYMDEIFGFDFKSLKKKKKQEVTDREALDLLKKRNQAKLEKDYSKADNLRKELEELGYLVKDTKDGSFIEKKM